MEIKEQSVYAHSNGSDPSKWQPLEEHLNHVAELAAEGD
jgi:hypothetical protein